MKAMFQAVWRGFRNHFVALLTLVGVGIVVLFLTTGGVYVASHNDNFCASCHYMKPYSSSGGVGHEDVACISCHPFRPVRNAVSFVRYMTDTYDPRPRAEITNETCLQSGCHANEDLDGDQLIEGRIHFDHTPHLTRLRRGKRLQCTSCHSRAVSDSHFAVGKETCFLCHFKGVGEAQAIGGCSNCHGTPGETVQHGGFIFNHASYLKAGVTCQQCHLQVAEGTGNVPQERCFSCHVERLDAYANSEVIHKTHLGEHMVDCFRCHEKIQHGEIQMIRALESTCDNCHKGLHSPQKEMYIGAGGEGVGDTPSRMFAAQVACDGCHTRTVHIDTGQKFDETSLEAERQSCVTCHGMGYDLMLDDWIREMTRLESALKPEVERAEAQLGRVGQTDVEMTAARLLIEKARQNYDFLRHGRGVHNVEYALNLAKAATRFIDLSMGQIDPSYQVPKRSKLLTSPDGYCSVLCHARIGLPEETQFDHMTFPHELHAEGLELECTTCHSPEKHKMRVITRSECMTCHHATEDIACSHCHREQDALYTGNVAPWGAKGEPDVMLEGEVACTGCHDLSASLSIAEIQKTCVECHEAGYDEMLRDWANEIQATLGRVLLLSKDLGRNIDLAQRRGVNTDEAKRLLTLSERWIQLVDTGKGIHNYALSSKLLEDAEIQMKQALNLVQVVSP